MVGVYDYGKNRDFNSIGKIILDKMMLQIPLLKGDENCYF
jgi:hypothetical protein